MKLFHQLLHSWIFLKYNPCCATHSNTTSATGEWWRSCYARPFLSWPALCLAPTRTVEFSPRSTASHCTGNKFCAFGQLIHLKLSDVIIQSKTLSPLNDTRVPAVCAASTPTMMLSAVTVSTLLLCTHDFDPTLWSSAAATAGLLTRSRSVPACC